MDENNPHPPAGRKQIWLICSDDDAAKTKLMNILLKLKLKKQHQAGIYASINQITPANGVISGAQTISGLLNPDNKPINNPDASPVDGRWITLQDWSQCTLKCGGGQEYQHLMCIPPRKGGKPCEGEAIRTRPCNTQPCPKIEQVSDALGDNNGQKIEKPIIKIMPISTRPQRYDKCYLKDTDAFMEKNDQTTANVMGSKGTEPAPRIPVRLVMNNKTISVYQDDTLHTNYMTFLLKDTIFALAEGEPTCFVLSGNNNKVKFCSLGDPKFVDEWDYDFNLFKNQCKQKRETVELEQSEEDRLKKEYNDKIVSLLI
jgi:hypothetical protein